MDLQSRILDQNSHWRVPHPSTPPFRRDMFSRLWKDRSLPLMSLITGPRRTGKSVLLKQISAELVKEHIPATQILFFEFKQTDDSDLIWQIWDYFSTTTSHPRQRCYVFFDEIQFVKDYEPEIKLFYDQKPQAKIFLTGSLSLTYKRRMSESLAGRFLPYPLFPLKFSEYLHLVHSPQLKNLLEISGVSSGLRQSYLGGLNEEFRTFLRCGRLPEMVAIPDPKSQTAYLESIINQSLSQDAFSYFQIEKPHLLLSLFHYIRQNSGGLVSLENLSNLAMASRETVSKYLDVLEIMRLIYPVSNSISAFAKHNAARKIYVSSHFLDSKHDPQTALGLAVESYILERLLEQEKQATFFRRRNKEVDFVLPEENLAYEIKFRHDVSVPKNPLPKNFELRVISATGPTPACLF